MWRGRLLRGRGMSQRGAVGWGCVRLLRGKRRGGSPSFFFVNEYRVCFEFTYNKDEFEEL